MNKKELRKKMKKLRCNLSSQRKKEVSLHILEKFQYVKNTKTLSFASTDEEINLWPLNEKLRKKNVLALPKIIQGKLKIFSVKNFQKDLKKSSFNILEPIEKRCEELSLSEISYILVPGLAFDKKHHRLGYGKGYYDRLLAKFKGISIGLCFQEQFLSLLPIEMHDQPLSYLYCF